MEGFTSYEGTFRWETPNLELDSNAKFALSSVIIKFEEDPEPEIPIIMSTSLMEKDSYNTDGVVAAFQPSKYSFFAPVREYWNLDSSRPRNILFTLRGVDVSHVSFVRIVVAFE